MPDISRQTQSGSSTQEFSNEVQVNIQPEVITAIKQARREEPLIKIHAERVSEPIKDNNEPIDDPSSNHNHYRCKSLGTFPFSYSKSSNEALKQCALQGDSYAMHSYAMRLHRSLLRESPTALANDEQALQAWKLQFQEMRDFFIMDAKQGGALNLRHLGDMYTFYTPARDYIEARAWFYVCEKLSPKCKYHFYGWQKTGSAVHHYTPEESKQAQELADFYMTLYEFQ